MYSISAATLGMRLNRLTAALKEHGLLLALTPANVYVVGSLRHRNRVLAGIDGVSISDWLGKFLLFEEPTAKVLAMRISCEFEMRK